MNDGPAIPESGDPQRTTTGSGTPLEASRSLATRQSTRAFAPAEPTPVEDPAPLRLPAGALVGKYRILEAIGGGGMGFVYRALHPDLGCLVALKVIRAGELASSDAVRRFERECRALARFRHANIVTVHDAGEHRGQPFLVMEYLGGGSLARNLPRYQADARAAVALIEKVARAVQQLHADGVLHRDLKPANVLLDDEGEPRVGDFGLVKLLDSADELTGTGHYPGTAPYMAPEQTGLVIEPLGPPTDVWALGVMLYELLIGSRPFAAPDRTTLLHQIVMQEPRRPRTLRPALDADLEAVVLKCLNKDAAQRFATAGDLADELARWLRGEPTQTRPEGRLRLVGRALRRHPRRTALAALALAVVLIALVVATVMIVADPERAVRAELQRGGPVVLVPDRASPRWWEAAVGTPVVATTEDGYFSVQAGDPVLLMLVRTLPYDAYRLRAKVRHIRGEPGCEVGLFVGYQSAPCPHGLVHVYQTFTYNDVVSNEVIFAGIPPGNPAANAAALESRILADIGMPLQRQLHAGHDQVRFKAAQDHATWRRLEITVRAADVRVSFDRVATQPVTVAALQKAAQRQLDRQAKKEPIREGFLAGAPSAFDSRGAVGLYIAGARAAFTEVVIEPLPPP